MAYIKLKDVTFTYQYFPSISGGLFKSNAGLKSNLALTDFNLEIKHGDRVALFGQNGAGKSTLLKTIAGVIKPEQGEVLVDGTVYSFFGRNVGVMPQLSGFENLKIRGLLLNLSDEAIETKLDEIAEFTELGNDLHRPVSSYSQGMKARLTFGMLMFIDAEILLIDEGLAAGDQFFIEKAQAFVEQLLDSSKILIFASHSVQLLRKFCNKAIFIDQGRVIKSGDFNEVLKQYNQSKKPA